MPWITLALLLAGTITDLRRREVPDAIPLALLATGACGAAFGWSAHAWTALLTGAATGLVIGALLFWRGAFGGGDVKIVTALGACLGPAALLNSLFYTALAGAVLALAALARGTREIAYLPAITTGFVVSWAVRGLP